MTSTKTAKLISNLMLDKQGTDIKIINVGEVTSISDMIVICTSDSDPKTRAIFNHIIKSLKEIKIRPIHTEGQNNLNWVLIDFVDVIAMIFTEESRQYYQIERLWADGKLIETEK